MTSFSDLISIILYIFILAITVFIIVYASLQIRNYNDIVTSEIQLSKKTHIIKWIIISILSVILCTFIYNQVFNTLKEDKNNNETKYKRILANLQQALIYTISLNDESSYKTEEDFAHSLIYGYPVNNTYYFEIDNTPELSFTDEETEKYNLQEYKNKPSFTRADGILISVIKFKKGCKNIDTENLLNSDCVLEADVNHFQLPNKNGLDRAYFAIDGIYNTVKTNYEFFE